MTTRSRQNISFGYAIISVALVLVMLGLIGLIYIQTNSLIAYFKENVAVLVELKADTSNEQTKILKSSLEKSDFIKPGSLVFTSKERGAHLLAQEFGKDITSFGFENPLFDILQFKMKPGYEHPDSLAQAKSVIAGNPLVNDVYIQEGMLNNINDYLKRGTIVGIAIALLFLIIAISLIYNTIRLALFSNRMVIKSMQLVGAKRSYIQRPYLWKSIKNGAISAMIAVSILMGLLLIIHFQLPEVAYLENSVALIALFLLLFALGILINLFSTTLVIRRYLNMRIEEAY